MPQKQRTLVQVYFEPHGLVVSKHLFVVEVEHPPFPLWEVDVSVSLVIHYWVNKDILPKKIPEGVGIIRSYPSLLRRQRLDD